MQLAIADGKKIEVSEATFGREFSEALVHQVVTAYLAGARSGTKGQKNRSAVSGGGKKPFKQKGTGRARAGTIRSPIWRGGGKTFAAVPRDHSQKVNRKMYRGAVQAILSELVRQSRLIVVESFELAQPKTQELVEKLASLEFTTGLIVSNDSSDNLFFACRNLPGVNVLDVSSMDPVSLVGAEKVIMTVDAVEKVQEWLG